MIQAHELKATSMAATSSTNYLTAVLIRSNLDILWGGGAVMILQSRVLVDWYSCLFFALGGVIAAF
jgi:hypothetical protein